MFLFSGRGYWQELIESIVWAHNKLKVAPATQPRALSIVDDFSRKLWIYIQKTKDEAFDNFKSWKTLVESKQAKRSRGFILIMVLISALNLSMIFAKIMALQGIRQLRAPLNKMV